MQLKLLDDAGKEIISLPVEVRDANKSFSSGALGFYAGGKYTIQIGGKVATYQVSASFTEIGTKDEGRAKIAADFKANKAANRKS